MNILKVITYLFTRRRWDKVDDLANFFCQIANLRKLAKHIQASHDGFDDFGRCKEFGKSFVKLPSLCKLAQQIKASHVDEFSEREELFTRFLNLLHLSSMRSNTSHMARALAQKRSR